MGVGVRDVLYGQVDTNTSVHVLSHPMVSEEKTPDLPAELKKPPATDDVQTTATDYVQTEEPLKVIKCHVHHTPHIVWCINPSSIPWSAISHVAFIMYLQ